MRIFFKQKKIKFIKRKRGKERTAKYFIGDFEKFVNKVRLDSLQTTEDDGADGI